MPPGFRTLRKASIVPMGSSQCSKEVVGNEEVLEAIWYLGEPFAVIYDIGLDEDAICQLWIEFAEFGHWQPI